MPEHTHTHTHTHTRGWALHIQKETFTYSIHVSTCLSNIISRDTDVELKLKFRFWQFVVDIIWQPSVKLRCDCWISQALLTGGWMLRHCFVCCFCFVHKDVTAMFTAHPLSKSSLNHKAYLKCFEPEWIVPKGMIDRYLPLNLLATVISCLRVQPRSEITWCAAAGGWWLTWKRATDTFVVNKHTVHTVK